MNFKINEYDHEEITYFHLDVPQAIETKEIETEIFKEHISVRVKGKLLQIQLWEEIYENPIRLQRSKATGQLYIELRKKRKILVLKKDLLDNTKNSQSKNE